MAIDYIGETFDMFCDEICSVCKCNNDMCSPLEDNCRFICDMEELKKACDNVDNLKLSLLHFAQDDHFCFDNPYEDIPHDRDFRYA